MNVQNQLYKSAALIALVTGFLLLIPLLAMQFTNEVNWNLFDFIFAGVLIFGTAFSYQLTTKKKSSIIFRIAIGLAIGTNFILIWANGAVGIIGSENNPFNLLFFVVVAIWIIGATVTRLKSQGMFIVMLITAFVQALLAVIALIEGIQYSSVSSVNEILFVNGFFVFLWVVSALLFKRVAEQEK